MDAEEYAFTAKDEELSDIELAVILTKRLEHLLEKEFRAKGISLGIKTHWCHRKKLLSPELKDTLDEIKVARNTLVHEWNVDLLQDIPDLNIDRDKFIARYVACTEELLEIASEKKKSRARASKKKEPSLARGSRVHFKDTKTCPDNLGREDVGVVVDHVKVSGRNEVVVNFPSLRRCSTRPQNLEIDAVAELMQEGARISLRLDRDPPRKNELAKMIGKLKSISDDDGKVTAMFCDAAIPQWIGELKHCQPVVGVGEDVEPIGIGMDVWRRDLPAAGLGKVRDWDIDADGNFMLVVDFPSEKGQLVDQTQLAVPRRAWWLRNSLVSEGFLDMGASAAASRIQACYRGFRVRKRIRAERQFNREKWAAGVILKVFDFARIFNSHGSVLFDSWCTDDVRVLGLQAYRRMKERREARHGAVVQRLALFMALQGHLLHLKRSALTIQAALRNNASRTHAASGRTYGRRCLSALGALFTGQSPDDTRVAISTISDCTRESRVCCYMVVDRAGAGALVSSQSKERAEDLLLGLQALHNICSHRSLVPEVFTTPGCLYALTDRLQSFRDHRDVFLRATAILLSLCDDPERSAILRQEKPLLIRKWQSIGQVLARNILECQRSIRRVEGECIAIVESVLSVYPTVFEFRRLQLPQEESSSNCCF